MVVAAHRAPADNIGGDLSPSSRADVHLADEHRDVPVGDARRPRPRADQSTARRSTRIAQTLRSVETLERHEPSGQFYNWYDPATLAEAHHLAGPTGNPVYPFLSSVDNGWLASALIMVANAVPAAARPGVGAGHEHGLRLLLRPERQAGPSAGLIRGGFWLEGGDAAAIGRLPARRLLRHGRGRGLHRPPLRRLQHRAAHRLLHRHRPRPDPAGALLRPVAHVPRHLRLVVAGAEAGRRVAHLPRRRRVRGRLPLRRPAASCRPGAAACSRR